MRCDTEQIKAVCFAGIGSVGSGSKMKDRAGVVLGGRAGPQWPWGTQIAADLQPCGVCMRPGRLPTAKTHSAVIPLVLNTCPR